MQGIQWLQDLLATYEKTEIIEEAFRFSVASGSATAFSLGLCTSEKVEETPTASKIREIDKKRRIIGYENY